MSPLPPPRVRRPNSRVARLPGAPHALPETPNNRGDRARRVRCAAAEVAGASHRDERGTGRPRRCTRPRHGAHTPGGNASAIRRCSERRRPCGCGCGEHSAALRRARPCAELLCLNVGAAVCVTRCHNREAVQRQGREGVAGRGAGRWWPICFAALSSTRTSDFFVCFHSIVDFRHP